MEIKKAPPNEIIAACRSAFGLSRRDDVDDILLTEMARRSAGFHCPCSRTTLRASLEESLQLLCDIDVEQIDSAIERLVVGGDLLELRDVITTDGATNGTWVYSAPPTFVVRPSGSIFLTGVVPNQSTFLPPPLSSRVVSDGYTRVLKENDREDLSEELLAHGFQALPESIWLRAPKAVPAQKLVDEHLVHLGLQNPCGAVGDIELIDTSHPVRFYRGRWVQPVDQTGMFVARRKQRYGAALWCVVEVIRGEPLKLFDLPKGHSRWRGCDEAWRLQMAIDSCANSPQEYQYREMTDGVRLDFFSPLPQWAVRRLMIFGEPIASKNSLFSYLLPPSEASAEHKYLQERLWLRGVCNSN